MICCTSHRATMRTTGHGRPRRSSRTGEVSGSGIEEMAHHPQRWDSLVRTRTAPYAPHEGHLGSFHVWVQGTRLGLTSKGWVARVRAATSHQPRRKPARATAAIPVAPESAQHRDASLPERVILCHRVGQGVYRASCTRAHGRCARMGARVLHDRCRSSGRRSTPAVRLRSAILWARPPDARDHRQRLAPG